MNMELRARPGAAAASPAAADGARLAFLEQVAAAAGEAFVAKDLDGFVTYWNAAAADLYGYSPQEAIGLPLRELHAGNLAASEYERVLTRIRAGVPTSTIRERRRKDGRRILVHNRTTPIFDANGRLVGELSIARDITAEQRAKARMWEVQARLTGVVDHNMDAFLILDEDLHIDGSNAAAERMFGVDGARLALMSFAQLIPSLSQSPQGLALLAALGADRSGPAIASLGTMQARCPDGATFPVDVSISKAGFGERNLLMAVLRDPATAASVIGRTVDTEHRMELALEGGELGMWDYDAETRVLNTSDRIPRMLGYEPGEMESSIEALDALLHPDDRSSYQSAFYGHLRGILPNYEVDYRWRHRMGHWIWIAARGKVVRRDENGRAQRIIGTCQDISARKALEEKEQRVTRAFQLLSQCSSILVRANDENQLLDSVCHLCTEVGGYRMAWVGFAIHDEERSVHPAAWAGQESGYLESARISWGDGVRGQGPTGTAMRTGATVAIQNMPMAPSMAPWRAAASQRGYQSCIALPLRVGEATVGVLSLYSSEALSFGKDEVELLEQLAHDLSYGIQALRLRGRRDAAESELRDARERLETALEASGFSIWEFDATTGLVTHDERWAILMGLPPGKVAIPAREFWRIVHPDDLPAVRAATVDAFKGKTARYVQEWRARSAAGEWRWIRSVGRIVELSLDGRALRSIGTNVDITEQKTHELELARARKEAEAANLAKSQFLATMSHEIRTPMNGILGMAELLQTPGLAAEDREDYLRVIIGSGHSLLSLLNDILDLSKIEAGRVELETIPFDAEETLGDVAMLFGKRASEKGLAIEVRWNGARGAAYRSDPVRLRQMISNLVSNAIKFTNHGIIRIEGRQVEGSPDQAILEFSVQDTGIGIPKEFQAQLFQPFTQADATMTRKFGGSGLGLSIVRSLAQRMGGDSWLESEVGLGTKVWLRIRSGVAHGAVAAPVDAPATAVPPATHEPNPQYGNARILIVEDNPTNRKVVEGLLRREGLAFESVDDGEKALARVTSGEPTDLVLMDCQMPVMDGWEATRRIRQWERDSGQTLRLPIVALTAGAFETDRQQCRLAGMDDFLAKPLSVRELRAALAKWLAVREQVAGS